LHRDTAHDARQEIDLLLVVLALVQEVLIRKIKLTLRLLLLYSTLLLKGLSLLKGKALARGPNLAEGRTSLHTKPRP
jgi:hypothetical protein